jgi:hypothetical protein
MFKKYRFGEMPFEHFPKDLKLPKMPLAWELDKRIKDEDVEKEMNPKSKEQEDTKHER